jgi:CRP/FNR family nitrogen fixation transcriptional regulator
MLLLGRKFAIERVAAFLIEIAAAASMTLPMCRRDTADYRALTIETVSRALSKLRDAGVLKIYGLFRRVIIISDRRRLSTFDS